MRRIWWAMAIGLTITVVGTVCFVLYNSDIVDKVALLSAPGVVPGGMISGLAKGSSHGGDTLPTLLIGTPINLCLYTGLSYVSLSLVAWLRRKPPRG